MSMHNEYKLRKEQLKDLGLPMPEDGSCSAEERAFRRESVRRRRRLFMKKRAAKLRKRMGL